MLTLTKKDYPLPVDDYYITHKEDGLDELNFTLLTSMPEYQDIDEEDQIYETTEGIYYLVKAIDAGEDTVAYKCQVDLDEWRDLVLGDWGDTHTHWSYQNKTAHTYMSWLTPPTWTIGGDTSKTVKASIELPGPTRLDLAQAVMDAFGVKLHWDNGRKTVTMIYPEDVPLGNGYLSRSVNLKELGYTGKSSDFCTRLYAEGKDGLTFSSVNNNLPYLEDHSWSDKVVCGFYQDSACESAEELLAAAKVELASRAMPQRSWTGRTVDLFRIDPASWPDLSLAQWSRLRLQDERRGVSLTVVVAEDKVYPYYKHNNEVTISTVAASIQKNIAAIGRSMRNRNSTFWRQINAR